MAKSKKRTRTRPAGSSGPRTKQAATLPPVAPATPGGPNRLARKEEARRQREALRRKMARRRALRIVGAVVALLVVVAAIAVYLVTRPNPAEAAGCGKGVQTIAPYPGGNDRTHIGPAGDVPTPPPLSTYRSVPPASGPHDPTPEPAGVYPTPPGIYHVIHSLEHAAVVIWYPPGTSSAELTKIQAFYRDPVNQDHVIVAPYNYPDQGAQGRLPAGKQMVLVAWHHVESCTHLSLAAAQDFVKHYRFTTGQTALLAYKGDAPEAGASIG